MRKPTHLMALLISLPLLSGPALAWVPQLEETVAKNVIDGAYGRRAPVPTFLTVDLGVKDGQFVAGPKAVTAYMGGPACVEGWLAAPTDYSAGSRPASLTVSGQADQLFFQAQDARDSFKNLSAKEALGEDFASKRLANGELRVDVAVRGLPTEQARSAYLVRLKGKDGSLVAPVRSTYVNDWKPMTAAQAAAPATTTDATTAPAPATTAPAKGPYQGTLVYYFEPLKAGLGAGDKMDLLIKTEADTDCAYSMVVDLSKFQ
ncbi:hypothetical protein QR90_13090 [Deinococcus radiopugnans]|uniref:DUF4198 domain-containing protein n=1 Tax=Deinococcus radiopugnans TaxID=57497 RepID=A0A0A7KMG4_9DEIO|nr:hypothetical protein [Deinococcus radiopugnans]AIZ45803.1 hypothetical protein QR90_13090 [Deinococcus radiopugnans]